MLSKRIVIFALLCVLDLGLCIKFMGSESDKINPLFITPNKSLDTYLDTQMKQQYNAIEESNRILRERQMVIDNHKMLLSLACNSVNYEDLKDICGRQ